MGKMGKKQVLCILLGIILAVAGYLVEKRDRALEDGNRLNRYAYGEGERQQEVWVRGLCEKEIPVEISLGEREYAEEDAEFGAGCRLRPYRKLSGLLEQNVRNGAEGLRKALETEMESAFEEEKALARRRGEEASTKLMLPLFLMLMIIMVMVSVPAFLAFGI